MLASHQPRLLPPGTCVVTLRSTIFPLIIKFFTAVMMSVLESGKNLDWKLKAKSRGKASAVCLSLLSSPFSARTEI